MIKHFYVLVVFYRLQNGRTCVNSSLLPTSYSFRQSIVGTNAQHLVLTRGPITNERHIRTRCSKHQPQYGAQGLIDADNKTLECFVAVELTILEHKLEEV